MHITHIALGRFFDFFLPVRHGDRQRGLVYGFSRNGTISFLSDPRVPGLQSLRPTSGTPTPPPPSSFRSSNRSSSLDKHVGCFFLGKSSSSMSRLVGRRMQGGRGGSARQRGNHQRCRERRGASDVAVVQIESSLSAILAEARFSSWPPVSSVARPDIFVSPRMILTYT